MRKNLRMTAQENMKKDAWISSVEDRLRAEYKEKFAEAELNGYPFSGSDECLYEEAEESWHSNFSGSFEEKEEDED